MWLVLAVLLALGSGCVNNSECGSADNAQPGLCTVHGICQCGFGYSGRSALDPTSCSQVCSPPQMPNGGDFLKEPDITMSASDGWSLLFFELSCLLTQRPQEI
jgi:hypothetical protein